LLPQKFSKVGANGLEDRQARARGPALSKEEPAIGADFLGVPQSKTWGYRYIIIIIIISHLYSAYYRKKEHRC